MNGLGRSKDSRWYDSNFSRFYSKPFFKEEGPFYHETQYNQILESISYPNCKDGKLPREYPYACAIKHEEEMKKSSG
jgi:hypothetical protein